MKVSRKTRTRLVVLNVTLWAVSAVIALAVLGGPRGVLEDYFQPIDRELGGLAGLVYSSSGLSKPSLASYEIAVAPEAIHTAQLMRATSPGSQLSPQTDTPWVPARFRAEGEVYNVDLQLLAAPDGASELHRQAWRVRFGARHNYRGARELTLQSGSTLQRAREAMVRDVASRVGLMAPPSGLASLSVNGEEAGVIFWSEGSSAEMLQRLGYSGGEILTPRSQPHAQSPLSGVTDREIVLADYSPAIHRDPKQDAPAQKLRRLIELTRTGSDDEFAREIGQLLDVDKYLRWNALAWVFGDASSEGFQRPWYFDAVTGLLEPVVTDLERGLGLPASLDAILATDETRLISRLLQSAPYRAQRNRALWQLVSRSEMNVEATAELSLGQLLTDVARADGSLARLGELQGYAQFRRTSRLELRERVASIRAALEASEIETRTHPTFDGRTPTLTLELAPRGLAEILLTELRLEFGSALQAVKASAAMRLIDVQGAQLRIASVSADVIGSSITLRPEHFGVRTADRETTRGSQPAWKVEIELPFLSREQWRRPGYLQQVEVAYRNAVTGEALPTARIDASQFAMGAGESELRRALRPIDVVVAESGLPFEVVGDELVLHAGSYVLAETLVVPDGHRLRLESGVNLRLGPDVSIISFRGLSAQGTRQRPVRIRRSVPEEAWGSIAIVRAPEVSELAFVTISGGSTSSYAGVDFGGQLSFNASDFSLIDSEIQGAYKSDGVSAKRATYTVIRSQFVSNASDGFDSKWSQGAIRDSWFSTNGDDGLDLVDSRVTVQGCAFTEMGDKSISAGMRSQVAVSETRLVDSEVAIASKADSRVDVSETEFRGNRLGFSLYRGKPIFGGGLGTVRGGLFAENDRDFQVEPGSDLQLLGVDLVDVGTDSGVDTDSSASAALRAFNRVRPVAFRPRIQSAVPRLQFNMLYNSNPVNGKNLY